MTLPFVWKCGDSFLIGTHHGTRTDYTGDINRLLIDNKIKTIFCELPPEEELDKTKMFARPGYRAIDVLNAQQLEKLKAIAKSYGLDFDNHLANLKLFWIFMYLSILQHLGKGVERQILAVAKKLKIPIYGLENCQEQLTAVEMESEEEHLQLVLSLINNSVDYKKMQATFESTYKSGDGKQMTARVSIYQPGHTVNILKRNKIMAERALPFIQSGKCAVAVGVGHLLGKYPMQYFLKKQGMNCERVFA